MNPQIQYGSAAPRSGASRLKQFVIAGVVLLAAILLATVIIKLLTPTPEKKIAKLSDSFFTAFIFENDPQKAYAMTDETFQASTSLEDFTAESARLHKIFTQPFQKKKFLDDNGTLIYAYTGTASDGTYNAEAGAVPGKGDLKIQYYWISRNQ